MQWNARRLFPYVILVLAIAAVGYAVSFEQLPPADFSFVNGTDIKSVDPALVYGVPEGRIVGALFEGIYQNDPKTLAPLPALALRHDLSDDEKTYTFHLRKEAKWNDGTPITAEDMRWSWMRFLHPETASTYAYQLTSYVLGAEKYNAANVEPGDKVEVELNRPLHPSGQKQLFPRGEVIHGVLRGIEKPPKPKELDDEKISAEKKSDIEAQWRKQWVYTVEIDGRDRKFSVAGVAGTEKCEWVLYDFREVGIRALEDGTFQVELKNPTRFFDFLMTFYPLSPVNRACIEKHGVPNWTKPENIVNNGPYNIEFRRIRDRVRMVKNPTYWDAKNVQVETIDALAVGSTTTGLNMFLNGQTDWVTTVPSSVIPELKKRPDYHSAPQLTTYFYRINTTRKPLGDVRIRQALNFAIDKQAICDAILRAGQLPAESLVPPGMVGYPPEGAAPALTGSFDPEKARKLLADAGFSGGKGLPTITLLYNDLEAHKTIAERVMHDWQKHLGIDVELKAQEWGAYLDSIHNMDYMVARSAWVGDYPDPNTFLDMFVTDGTNNETGWGSKEYDEMIAKAATTDDPIERMKALHRAEQIFVEEVPVIPLYFYVSNNMVATHIDGFYSNLLDIHPLHHLRVDPKKKARLQEGTKAP